MLLVIIYIYILFTGLLIVYLPLSVKQECNSAVIGIKELQFLCERLDWICTIYVPY